ncbi:hypothetical protein Rhe02_82810 [Rhizocola hellebori]|uniref:Uncharacterized protein n=1 Tax=Rhizocola hellebori TaxID=1392758 RepID=A0A8J3QFU9_9ACTN|nr:hypothetical protein [Rhizocola hellebori]GIH10214.1 hypothetical protein Rhe02_82810 [Rhizocola hellebori]
MTAPLDYYLILSAPPGSGRPEGILVEQFARHNDATTAGLHNAGWTAQQGWWSSASFSRAVRTDPGLAARIVPAQRDDAEVVYRRHGGGPLPAETVLRQHFHDYLEFPATPPLVLGAAGVDQRRLYRVLFAKDLTAAGLANLRARWRCNTPPDERVLARSGQDLFNWDLRRIGPGLAYCLDVTVSGGDTAATVGPVLDELTAAVRQQGLIPVTTERFG